MKRSIFALIISFALLAGLAACGSNTNQPDASSTGTDAGIFTKNAVTAYTIDMLGNADDAVQMLVLLSDGWILDVSLGGYYRINPGVNVKYHFIRDLVSQELLKIDKIPTKFNPADMGTKVVPVSKFHTCRDLLKIKSL